LPIDALLIGRVGVTLPTPAITLVLVLSLQTALVGAYLLGPSLLYEVLAANQTIILPIVRVVPMRFVTEWTNVWILNASVPCFSA
jgi:hypothetical protein